MITPLVIPSGAVRLGSEYESRVRWRDVNLVRWHPGLQPVQGWRGWTNNSANKPTSEPGLLDPVHGAMAWTTNNGTRYAIFGYSTNVYVMAISNATITDVTPAGHTAGQQWGTFTGTEAFTWTFAAFGELPLACMVGDGDIYEWDLNTSNDMTVVTNSPSSCIGVHVTPERFVMALGDGGDSKSIRWSDRDNRTLWTPASTNQAGGFDLDTEGKIRFAANARGQTVIVTTADVWAARYVGYPDVYAFDRIGDATCVGNLAWTEAAGSVFFMGHGKFHVVDGGQVRTIPCDIEDYVFADMEARAAYRFTAWHNDRFNEVWWHYLQTGGSNESPLDRYVSYNYMTGDWGYGDHAVTSVTPRGTVPYPVGFATGVTSQLATNGDFSSDTVWSKGTNWQITGGYANQTSPAVSEISQVLSLPIGDYRIEVIMSDRTVGGVTVGLTGGSFSVNTNGTTKSIIRINTTTPTLTVLADGVWDGRIQSVLVYKCHIVELDVPFSDVDLGGAYQHGSLPYAETGPLDIGDGERRAHVLQVIPDQQDSAELSLTFKTKEYPNGSETTHGPYTCANPTDVRFSGRQFKMKVAPVSNVDWRSGVHRLDIMPGGKR